VKSGTRRVAMAGKDQTPTEWEERQEQEIMALKAIFAGDFVGE
jgi:hypothetical protein